MTGAQDRLADTTKQASFILKQERASLQAQLEWHHNAIWKAVERSLGSLENSISKVDATRRSSEIVPASVAIGAPAETSSVEMIESIDSEEASKDQVDESGSSSNSERSAKEDADIEDEGSSHSCSVDDGIQAHLKGNNASVVVVAPTTSDSVRRRKSANARLSKTSADIRALLTGGDGLAPTDIHAEDTRVRAWLRSCMQQRFEALVGIMVVANTGVAFAHLQHLGHEANQSLGLSSQFNPDTEVVFKVVETTFAGIFTLELLLRLYAFRLEFFSSVLNILDAVIVVLTLLDLLYFDHVAEGNANISVLRLVRIARVVRVMRIARTLKAFQELRIILKTMQASIGAVFWSMILMFVFMLMMAMLLCQLLHDFVIDEDQDLTLRQLINELYGSGSVALQTVFKATFSGCWPTYADPVVNAVGPYYFPVWAAYVIAVVFTMSRIVSAMFVGETLRQASAEAETMVRDKMRETNAITKKLDALFRTADTSKDGHLTEEELADILANENVRLLLAKLGVDATDGNFLFHLLDDGTNGVSRDAFVSGVKRLKGEARSIDLVPLARDCGLILEHCQELRRTHADISIGMKEHCQELRKTFTEVPRAGRQMTFI